MPTFQLLIFFYFKSNPFYTPLANALFCSNNDTKANCVLIVSKESVIDSIEQLKGKIQGYIHPYCTSSYFALALLLWKNHFSIHDFYSSLKETEAWQEQIDAVILEKVDANMVLESVWNAQPSNKEKTRIIAKELNLPSPIILHAKNVDVDLLSDFKKTLFSYKLQDPTGALFNGFVPFQKELIEKFFSESTKAFSNNPH